MNWEDLVEPCVMCGYCCTKRPCFYGIWNEAKGACAFLTSDTKCDKYAEIVASEVGTKYPMFGCGCSSSLFNDFREEKLRTLDTEETGQ